MSEVPIESPNKYGRMDDDPDELADLLLGREPHKRVDPHGGFGISHTDAIDADFFREAGIPNKYLGREARGKG